MSYTEFSYMLLQAYDFLHLYKKHGCRLQMGGSDQWGNITCGTDLIKKKGGKAGGLTFPLLTSASGEKFGKSASGAVWLDPTMTPPYRFHQFWLNVEDEVVIQYLKYFTSLSKENIENIEEHLRQYANKRIAQSTLADAVTRLVHGEGEVLRANQIRELLFGSGGDFSVLKADEIDALFHGLKMEHDVMPEEGLKMIDFLQWTGLYGSRSDIRRSIDGGGIYMNGGRIEDSSVSVTNNDLIHGKYIIMRKGKKDYTLIAFDVSKKSDLVVA